MADNRQGRRSRQNVQAAVLCAALAVSLALAAVLRRGLFFNADAYPLLAVWFPLCGAAAAGRLWGSRKRSAPGNPAVTGIQRGSSDWAAAGSNTPASGRNGAVIRRAVPVILAGPFLLAALYAAALAGRPVSVQGTLNEVLRWNSYGCFAALAWSAAAHAGAARLLRAGWHAAGLLLCLSGLLAYVQVLPLPAAVLHSASPAISATGSRLGGLLQYPNAYGAAMAVFLLERLFAAAQAGAALKGLPGGERSSPKAAVRRPWERAGRFAGSLGNRLPGTRCARQPLPPAAPGRSGLRGRLLDHAPLFPYAAALLLSESRGAWLAAAVAAAAALALQRRLALPLLAAGAAPAAGAALLSRGLSALPAGPGPGLALLAGLWAGAVAAGLWLCRRVSRAGGRGGAAAGLAALGWTAGGAAVLIVTGARGAGPSSTAGARALIYRDALRLAAESPWLGRGGETWRSVYLAVQSSPYVGSQVHSGWLDLLLNLGAAGTAAGFLILAAAGWLTGIMAPRLLAPLLVIFIHGAVDFDWSYSLFWLLLFWLPALARAEARASRYACSSFSRETLPLSKPECTADFKRGSGFHPLCRRAGAVCACIGLIALGTVSFRGYRGEVLYREAATARSASAAAAFLETSLSWNPYSAKSAAALVPLLQPEAAREAASAALRLSPFDPGLSWAAAKAAAGTGSPGEALYGIRRALRSDRFNRVKQTEGARLMLDLGRRKWQEGDAADAARCAEAAGELLRQYFWEAGRFEDTEAWERNDRDFRFTAEARALGGQIEALRHMASGRGDAVNPENGNIVRASVRG